MARQTITYLAPGAPLVELTDVLMPNGERRDYADFGRAGFARILKRVKTDKAVIRLIVCLERLADGQKALPEAA